MTLKVPETRSNFPASFDFRSSRGVRCLLAGALPDLFCVSDKCPEDNVKDLEKGANLIFTRPTSGLGCERVDENGCGIAVKVWTRIYTPILSIAEIGHEVSSWLSGTLALFSRALETCPRPISQRCTEPCSHRGVWTL